MSLCGSGVAPRRSLEFGEVQHFGEGATPAEQVFNPTCQLILSVYLMSTARCSSISPSIKPNVVKFLYNMYTLDAIHLSHFAGGEQKAEE
jgi:hypothetical protein